MKMGCSPSMVFQCVKNREKLADERKKTVEPESIYSLVKEDISDRSKDPSKEFYIWDKRRSYEKPSILIKKSSKTGEGTNGDFADEQTPSIAAILSTLEEDVDYLPIKGPQDLKPNLLTTIVPGVVKILLVFARDDQQSEVLGNAARRLGWSVTFAKTLEKAVEAFHTRYHDVVIIDHRGHRGPEADNICRAIRTTNCSHNTVVIALVKKSFLTASSKDEIVIVDLLETGFSRTMTECSHEGILVNEMVGIYSSEVQPRNQLSAIHTLYLAVDRCRDMVQVTNDRHTVQFVNKASEKLLGHKVDEMVGKDLTDIVTCENFVLMDQQLQRGREFEGNMTCKRKGNDTITINCRIVPFCANGKKPTHYIYIHDTTYLLENMGAISSNSSQHPRGSLYSLRRGSCDVRSIGSDTPRRSSLTKLNNLPLEAPITRVISLLTNAMADTISTNPEIAMQIDKAIETLKITELYAPYLKEDTKLHGDPVATDFIGALISAPPYCRDSRRSSNDSSSKLAAIRMINSQGNHRASVRNLPGNHEIMELLDTSLEWTFEIFDLEVVTARRPLVYLGMNLMGLYRVPERLNCDEKVLQNWLTVVEMNYHVENSYHNSTHAADVLQAIGRFLQAERLRTILDPLDEVAALIAAAAHDIDHPGRSSQFLTNTDNKLAILYNDLSVLESHHAALTFKLTLVDDSVNIFKNLEREAYKLMRQNVVDMILATEMSKHFEHLAKFVNVCSIKMGDGQSELYTDTLDNGILLQAENVALVKRMMIKCADVSNPARPFKCCIEWARRIAEEYFNQTDEEKEKKMPIVMPMFDRLTCSIPKSQIGFVDYIINDMIEAWDAFIDMPELVDYMRQNYEKWKEYHEQGISTLQDIEMIQKLPELQIARLS
ncbi:high affinity cAMP-specific and IBMX-insensitive 3',5'-cyclic phosphodiesterase 8 isoform X2 [Orussus abietinus]|uniref:high affinity cAMP-specific and IBMX-insensitive 3',5'-cyclic phosphodiesterase 8 isoform X2 n=1 Tax=Orussus abietinus TaxID=222816 RepID=UPI000626B887|nr:high affinity cAMP-specific and IBMX-insensitive 3',5'-cyclic phosphodiesterase 8 isoform X2 [Orussus abietinus]